MTVSAGVVEKGSARDGSTPAGRPGEFFDAAVQRLDAALSAVEGLAQDLHRHPEVGGQEETTRDRLLAALPESARVERTAGTGAVVRYGPAGPAVGIRAELDALPIVEATGAAWASANGAMHACGHDVHMAAAVAVVHALTAAQLPVPLVAVLQPREEVFPSGASDIVSDGVLDRNQVQAMIGVHVHPLIAPGSVACSVGAVNASTDEFVVRMTGQGGHAAYPHLGADPVLATAQFVVAAQQLVSRETDPFNAAVVSVCMLGGSDSPNVRPTDARAGGTIRAMHAADRQRLLGRLTQVAEGIALASGCTAEVLITEGEPILVNDAQLATTTQRYLAHVGLDYSRDLRSCGGDDFAYYAHRDSPALMMFAGVGEGAGHMHSPTFLPGPEALRHTALAMLAGYAGGAEIIARAGVTDTDGHILDGTTKGNAR